MRIQLFFIGLVGIFSYSSAQVGINTHMPSSTIEVRGSFEGNYREITGNNALTATDHHVSFSGTSNSTLTIPARSSTDNTASDFRGRKYYIKNNSATSTLTMSPATGDNFRLGGSVPNTNTIILKGGFLAIMTANGTGGWDAELIDSSSDHNWVLEYTDLNGFINTAQSIPTGAGFTTVNNCSITVTIPPYSIQTRIMLNFTGWGDVNTASSGTGSLRFRLLQTGTSSATYNSIMMSSWANTVGSDVRFNFPVIYSIAGLPAGTYTFNLQVRREGEYGSAPSSLRIWGVQSSGNVYIKN